MQIKSLSYVLIAGTFLFQFCSDNNPVETETDKEITASEIIGTSGGSVKTENGITLTVPQGAIKEETAIKVTSLNGNDFGELGVIGAKLEPNGLTFDTPATIRFPLPADWPESESPIIYEASGIDPSNFFVDGISGKLTGNPGAYFCEVEISHFSSLGAARNCHAGTIDFLLDDFAARGCSFEEMTAHVTERFGNKFTIEKLEKTNEFNLNNIPLQCFLDTYFDDARGFEEGEPVSQSFINDLIGYLVLDKKQVVVAFDKKWEDSNNDSFYDGFSHSALLEIVDGKLKLRQSVSVKDNIIQQLIEKNNKNVFWYPQEGELTADLINQFRETKTGVSLENELCTLDTPSCLWPNIPLEKRSTPYPAVRFYVSKYSGNKNPCETSNDLQFTKCWFKVVTGSNVLSIHYDDGTTTKAYTSGIGLTGYFEGSFSNNRFSGSVDTSKYDNTVTGSITVELNETRDLVTSVSVSFNVDNQSYTSTNQFSGINIPLKSINSSSGTFTIEGTQTCDQISSFTRHTDYEDREETLESFECDTGYEQITVFFSK